METPASGKVCVVVCPTDSVETVKDKLEPQININKTWQQIYLVDQNLDDQTKLSDLGEELFHSVLRVVRARGKWCLCYSNLIDICIIS